MKSPNLTLIADLLYIILVWFPFTVCVRTPTPSYAPDVMMNITAIKGQNVEFKCRIIDPGPYLVAFFRVEDTPRLISYDEQVFRQIEKYELKKKVTEEEWILTVKNVDETDAGGYSCQLNTNPVMARIGYLALRVPPIVSRSSTPSAVEVREGHNVTLNCEANGNPAPKITWRRQDRQIIRFNGATGYGASVYNGSELTLTRVSRKHMSEYVCVATNDIPPDETWTVKLHVTFEPSVIPQSTLVEVSLGSLARLVCNVEAWPRAMVTWYFNDVELFDSGSFRMEQSVTERYKTVHVLEVQYAESHHFGVYKCVAANDFGKEFATIRLVQSQPIFSSNQVLATEGSGDTEKENIPTNSVDDEDGTEQKEAISTNTELRQTSHSFRLSACTSLVTVALILRIPCFLRILAIT
ncbi:unnamed protein product [Bursaphelenchus xylophilus]|uniref:(pine wood nematode) hypothetical protein n=1 Tax=Bursaphelenchus xylophilus TaxID=6326 RepID=A0A7I8XKQ1_BURXY|nr:unnamed protein product [Bursaphelenchus xylophilus]CAG9085896.1 unnamed protein product [Bursaphelenchus xylophilus]